MRPTAGEIWLVEFEPQRGAEIRKTRPAVVLSVQDLDSLPVRTVVPIRGFRPHHRQVAFYISAVPTSTNGLVKESTIDCSQVKSFALERFVRRMGLLPAQTLAEVRLAVARCIGVERREA